MPDEHTLSETDGDNTPKMVKLVIPPNTRLLVTQGKDFKVEILEDTAAFGGTEDNSIASPSPK